MKHHLVKNSFLPIRVERSIFLVDLNDFQYTNLEVDILSSDKSNIADDIKGFEIPSYFNYTFGDVWKVTISK